MAERALKLVQGALSRLRRRVGDGKRRFFPPPALRAFRRLEQQARLTPRHEPGMTTVGRYTIRYTDLLTLCPQWWDIFVRESLRYSSSADAPRIIDAGANVGLASLYLKRSHPRARISAFEADPAIHECLRENLRRNGAADVDVTHAAVWTSAGQVSFDREGADSGAVEAVSPHPRTAGKLTSVPAVRLADVLSATSVDLLKLDVEGAEFDLIADCHDALRNVKAIVMEVHDLDVKCRRSPQLIDQLTAAGFHVAVDDLYFVDGPNLGEPACFPRVRVGWTFLVRAWRP